MNISLSKDSKSKISLSGMHHWPNLHFKWDTKGVDSVKDLCNVYENFNKLSDRKSELAFVFAKINSFDNGLYFVNNTKSLFFAEDVVITNAPRFFAI